MRAPLFIVQPPLSVGIRVRFRRTRADVNMHKDIKSQDGTLLIQGAHIEHMDDL